VIAAVVAALAALAGVALGRILDVLTESTKWLREHRSVAYAAFLGAAERYLSGVLVAQGAPSFRLSVQGTELDRIFGDLQVFGSDAAYSAAQEVRTALMKIHRIRPVPGDEQITYEDFEAAASPTVSECQAAFNALRSIMKRELKVK
jgi:hypothetical protein